MGSKQQKPQKIKPKELLEIVFLDVPNTENINSKIVNVIIIQKNVKYLQKNYQK